MVETVWQSLAAVLWQVRQIKPAQLAFGVHIYLLIYLLVFMIRIRSHSKRTFQLLIVRSCFSPAASVSVTGQLTFSHIHNIKCMQKYSDLPRTLTRGPAGGSAQDPVIAHRQFLDRPCFEIHDTLCRFCRFC